MRIDVISDTICPWCFIGKRRLELALSQCPDMVAEIFWHPYELHPEMPDEGASRDEFMAMKFGSPEQAGEKYDEIRAVGQEIGIHFAFDRMRTIPNTARSHALVRWATSMGEQTAAVEALFHAYFEDGRDVGDMAVLLDIADELGLPMLEAETWINGTEALKAVRRTAAQTRSMGIDGAPCYIIAEKYAVIGAQDPAVFLEIFDKVATEDVA